jgi:phosphoglycolate phosphatase-like HAD superfamily hydrolase
MMPLNIYTHMATSEEIRRKNLEASNEALSESVNLAAQLNDKMTFLYKMSKEKFTQDKLSLDLTKQTVALTKSLTSNYDSVKQVERDIAKNKKIQNDIARQQLNLEKEIGEEGKKRIQFIKNQEKGLSKSRDILKELREKEAAGVLGAKKHADELARQVMARQKSLNTQMQNLTFEEKQYMMLQGTSEVLEENNEYLVEQLRLQNNLAKSQGLITSALGGANSAMKKIGLGGLADKLGLEAATKKSQEMIYELTNGGQKALGAFGKLRVGIVAVGTALKSALGPVAIIGMLVSLFQTFKKNAEEAAEAIKVVDQNTKDLGRSLGVSDAVASKVAASARSIGSAMGITTTMATQAANQIYSALDGAEQVSQKTLDTFMKLNVFAGMSAESLAGMYRFAKLTGESAADVAQDIATTARESIRSMKVNVSMKQVMEGVAKTSNIIKLSFKGSAEELTKAFVSSKKLGLELQKVDDIAGSLLNFEDSIAAEMEAELLTGKNLNLEKAREAALLGDNAKLMEEIKQSGIEQLFLNAKTRFEQDAIARTLGMSRESMADMLADAKANEATNTELVDTQAQSLAAMQSMASVGEKLAALEEAKALSAAKSGNEFIKLQTAMLQLVTAARPLLEAIFIPLLEVFTKIVTKVTDLLKLIKDGNFEFGNLEKIIGSIAIGIGTFYTTIKGIKLVQEGLNKATLIYQGIRTFIDSLNKKEESSLIRRIALGLREAATQALAAIAKVTGASAATLGIAGGIALAAGAAAYAFFNSKESEIKQAGDLYSGSQGGGGYGNRLLVAPEGTFALNNNDTVIAGTSLFKGDDVVSSPAGSISMNGNTSRLEMLVERLIDSVERGGTVVLDGKKVGEALVVNSYRMQ